MELMRNMRKDRSGINALLAVVAVVVVIAVAAAAYVILADDGEKEIGPGTILKYETTTDGTSTSTGYEEYYLGQSADMWFLEVKTTFSSTTFLSELRILLPKANTLDSIMIGVVETDTIDGKKTLEVWEYVNGIQTEKYYIDPSNGLVYKQEVTRWGSTMISVLKEYELKWQKPYKESKSIGMTYEYTPKGWSGWSVEKIVCVADCIGGQYGMESEFTLGAGGRYYISDHPQGLPKGAEYTGEKIVLEGTIDGDISVDKWELSRDVGSMAFYVEPKTHVIYRVVFEYGNGYDDLIYDLTKKP